MATVSYIRVSSVQQNTVRQLDGVQADKTFTDKCTGSNTDRPQLTAMLEYIRDGDIVTVHDISRLARDMKDLLELIRVMNDKGVAVYFKKENLTFSADKSNPMNELMLNLLGSVYQFERAIIRERQSEGIAKAKAKGVYKGRPATIDKKPIIASLESGKSIRKTASEHNVSASTVMSIKKGLNIS